MSVLRVATRPVMDRNAGFLGNNDLGQLGAASTSLYKVVSIALTLWAIWGPAAPGGARWVGSPMVLNRPFASSSDFELVD
eukprot:3065475-Pyramimonas_sp.AAC.1